MKAVILAASVKNLIKENFVVLMPDNLLERIVEKPLQKVSDFINVGLYKFTPEIFSTIRKIRKSERGSMR